MESEYKVESPVAGGRL